MFAQIFLCTSMLVTLLGIVETAQAAAKAEGKVKAVGTVEPSIEDIIANLRERRETEIDVHFSSQFIPPDLISYTPHQPGEPYGVIYPPKTSFNPLGADVDGSIKEMRIPYIKGNKFLLPRNMNEAFIFRVQKPGEYRPKFYIAGFFRAAEEQHFFLETGELIVNANDDLLVFAELTGNEKASPYSNYSFRKAHLLPVEKQDHYEIDALRNTCLNKLGEMGFLELPVR